ncbi:putative ATP-dependent RNA helicase TDRD12 [Chironomus tepperi]|uniref:putative ATP-dependent RNA helicase TDRD12 n=1 Tax=Chironomus tepperi TaxID=113505 RepID=UPI00391EF014
MSNSVKVQLVNFRNPDEIYIKFLEGDKSRNKEKETRKVNRIQDKLARLSIKTEKVDYPKHDEIYGCYIDPWKRWIRGKYVLKQSYNGYTIFCIDHGHYKANVLEFINIPDELKFEKTQTYYKVSLGLNPLNMNRWSKNTVELCREIDNKKNCDAHFVPFFEKSNQFIGDLFLFDGNDQYSVSEKLISLGHAAKPTTNFDKIFNMLHDKDIGPLKTVQPKQRLEMYNSNSEKGLKPYYKLPNNLILHGNDLNPFLNSIDDIGFHNFLKKKFSYKNEKLSDIQKVIWPQIADGKHSFVISSNQECLTSIYILPLINNLLNRTKGSHFGPAAIIFTNNSSRIDEIAMQCENYEKKNISIIKAVGMCKDKKIDLMNGCDILITTPPAFIRLIQSASFKIIDVNVLKHVVFDNFDQKSLNLFDKELYAIIKTQYSSKIPQTIVVSKTYSNGLKTKLLNHLPAADIVKCMDNYLDAAAFVGLSISIEISTNSQDKINKLMNTNFDSYKNNVIVVSDTETLSVLEEKLGSNAQKCDSPKTAEIWDKSNPNNILIINDTILNDSIIQNADNLIHYDLPLNLCLAITTSDQFSKRFKVFHNEILKRLNSHEKVTALRTKIILSNENVSQFEELISLLIGRNLLKANEKVIEKIYEKNETLKCMNKVSLCQNLTQFGECMKFNCADRHKLSEQDKPPIHLEILKNFITFDLISQQGPTTFVIKIREYYDNKWISCVQSNEYIQQKLDVDMQRYCNEMRNALTLNEGKVGEIYAKNDNKLGKWVRGRIVKRKSLPIVELSLLDYVPDIPSSLHSLVTKCHETKLVKLPEQFTKLDPLLSKLQIMNLIPLDGEKSYNKSDVDKLNNFMRKIPKHAMFSAKIETIIGDVMFSKNIEAKNDNKTVIFRLTEAHSKLEISGTDENIFKRILDLSSTINNVNKDPVENREKELIKVEQNQSSITKTSTNKPTESVKLWKQLKHDTSYQIVVKEYISPYSFFVVLINHENLTVKNNLKAFEESKDHKQLISININECCLFKSNNRYLRAVILNILADGQIEVLLVDYGEIQKCDEKRLYEITREFLNFHFQAVHCSMLGICPKYNMKFWPEKQRSAVYKLISKYNQKSLKMLVVKDDQKKHQFTGTKVSSYNVMLYDDESKCFLNKLAVKEGIASECIEYNDELYESSTDDQDNDSMIDTSSWFSDMSNDNKELCSSLEMMKMAKSESIAGEISDYASGTDSANVMSNDSTESKYSTPIESSESTESMSTKVISNKSTEATSIKSTEILTSSLKSIFKLPHIEWRQNDFMIYLLISANDCTEYALSINETSLDVSIKYQDNNIKRTIIQLYGSLKPKFCSHELAGINIIVRLAKKLNGLNWPRLTMSKEKSIYIKFSDNDPCWHLSIDDKQKVDAIKPVIWDDDEDEKQSNDFESNVSSDDDFY